MEHFTKQNFFVLVVAVFLTACAERYGKQSLPNYVHGYSEVELVTNKTFVVKYEGTTRQSYELIETYWLQRAHELCPDGFNIIDKKQEKKRGTMKTPVNGTMINVGIWTPIVIGTIICKTNY